MQQLHFRPLSSHAWHIALLLVIGTSIAIDSSARTTATKFNGKPAPSVQATTDEYFPGVVLVKLTEEGAAQYAMGKGVEIVFGPAAAALSMTQAREAFAEHTMARYAPSQTYSFRRPSKDDDLSRIMIVRYSANIPPKDAAGMVARSPFVEFAEAQPVRKECFVPNDPKLSQQWHHAKIQSAQAWDIERGDTNVVIAIVDNGVDYLHEDLAANIWTNPGETGLDGQGHDKRTNGVDDDADGYVDDWHGWDFAGASSTAATQDNDPSGGDHGVHVAGIAAAVTNNGKGVAGVAHNCRLMVVKVAYDNSPGTLNFGFEGITYAADRGARIINCSWGGGSASTVEQAVIDYATAKGSLVVCAAGNNSSNALFYPASYNHVLSVTGSTSGDGPDPFYANYGPRVDVIAPGSSILSTYNGDTYITESGTSMASPCASGVAALVASHFPNYTPDQIAARVRVTSDPIDNALYYTFQKKFGRGRVNAYRAVHDANVKAVWIDSVWVDSDDNANGALEPGETGSIRVRFRNMLAPTQNLVATLIDTVEGLNPYVTINTPTANVGPVATMATATTASSEFKVHLAANTPQNTSMWFRIEYADGSYTGDYRYFQMVLNPTYITLDANDVALTVNSRGNSAYNDFPTNQQGVGFLYKGTGSLLYESALVIATDSTHVVDVARSDAQGGQDSDFTMTRRIALVTPAAQGVAKEATGEFDDSQADPSKRIGVHVAMHHYQYSTAGNRDYVILSYKLKNTTAARINRLFCGVYLDWDIGPSGDSNYVQYDNANRIGWIQRMNSSFPVCGAGLVSDQQTAFYALDNNANPGAPPFVVNDGYTAAEKFTSLASGIGRLTSVVGDCGNMMGGGPVSLAPGEETTFAFVLSAGKDLSTLQLATQSARQQWALINGMKIHPTISFPATYETESYDTTVVGAANNTGGSAVNATLSLAGTNAGEFSIVTPTTVPLSTNQKANVTVRFNPQSSGNKSALLLVDYGTSVDTFNVYGVGRPSGLGETPTALYFDTTNVGFASTKSIRITNDRADTVSFSIVKSGIDTAEFQVNLPMPVRVPPGGRTIVVEFDALHAGGSFAVLNLIPTTGHPFAIPLIGSAPSISAGVSIGPSALVFDTVLAGGASSRTVTVTNTRTDGISISVAFAIGGTDGADYVVSDSTSPFSVSAGTSAIFTVEYRPTHSGPSSAVMTVTPAVGDPSVISMSGYSSPAGVHDAGALLSDVIVTNFPDPFASRTRITVSGVDRVQSLVVYDVLGRIVADLSSSIAAGTAVFDATTLPAGTYYAKVGVEHGVVLRSMNVIK